MGLRLRLLPLAAFCLLAISLRGPSPAAAQVPRQWEVKLSFPGAYEALVAGDFDIESVRPGYSARILMGDGDVARLRALGFSPVLLDADPGLTMARRAARELGGRGRARAEGVPAFGSGSLGGFYTAGEIKAYLDSLHNNDTHGIFSRVDTVGWSYRHRPIWAIRVTGPSPGPKPRVFYNSLIHAREPEGMQNLLYFLGQLRDGYGVDPDITYLVDQRELYFVPLINPDGYAVNDSIYFTRGAFGLWRKNTRDNDNNGALTSNDGVDLNRNFGYKWGFDNVGSSGSFSNDTYRGPSAFSEPETKFIRNYCDSLHFTTGINNHTYSDLLIIPYGYSNVAPPDSLKYYEWVADYGRTNHYLYGLSPRILYTANGVADDWMYGETVEKPRAYTITVEEGNQQDGFWPPPSRILPLALEQTRANLGTAYTAGRWIRIQDNPQIQTPDSLLHPGLDATLLLNVKNRGLSETSVGVLKATLRSVDGYSVVLDSVSSYGAVAPGAIASPIDSGFIVAVSPLTPAGRVLNFRVQFSDDGGYSGADSFQVIVGTPTLLFSDSAETGTSKWVKNLWDTTSVLSRDPAHSFADSPHSYYSNNANNPITMAQYLNLNGVTNAYLTYWTRWDIEQDYDFGTVEITADSGATWSKLEARYTNPGAGNSGAFAGGVQPLGAPGYDVLSWNFLEDRANLTGYCGPGKPAVKIRFRLASDGGTTRDGWFVDDVRVVSYSDAVPSGVGETAISGPLRVGRPWPNPARDHVSVAFELARAGRVSAELFGVDGRRVATLLDAWSAAGNRTVAWDGRLAGGSKAAPGIYFLRVSAGNASVVRKVAVVR